MSSGCLPISSRFVAIGGSPTKCIYLPEGSAAQRAQEVLPEAKVISAFNNISHSWFMLLDEPIDCDCLICGDDKEAKALVTPLIEKVPGLRVIDCGGLERAARGNLRSRSASRRLIRSYS